MNFSHDKNRAFAALTCFTSMSLAKWLCLRMCVESRIGMIYCYILFCCNICARAMYISIGITSNFYVECRMILQRLQILTLRKRVPSIRRDMTKVVPEKVCLKSNSIMVKSCISFFAHKNG